MRHAILSLLSLLLIGCAGSDYSTMTEDFRHALTPEELSKTDFFVASRMDFVSLKKGEIVGEDIFKREVKKTITLDADTPGRLMTSGPQWLTVEFDQGIILTFRWDPVSEKYLTPGWGTVTIQNERFDIKQGVLSSGSIGLQVRKNK
jgi:hypothetical protein